MQENRHLGEVRFIYSAVGLRLELKESFMSLTDLEKTSKLTPLITIEKRLRSWLKEKIKVSILKKISLLVRINIWNRG